jgi:choline transporter-like protein 2/4/5
MDPANTTWFDALGAMTTTTDPNATSVVQSLQSAGISWINNYLASSGITASSSVNGKYYQLTSQIPGFGPCYPVWVQTTEYFHRCFPDFPSELSDTVVSDVGSGFASVGSEAGSLFKDEFNSASAQWDRYVSSISKGILIIIVGGLCGGVGLSLVRTSTNFILNMSTTLANQWPATWYA